MEGYRSAQALATEPTCRSWRRRERDGAGGGRGM